MRTLIVSEGANELEGALPTLVDRLSSREIEPECLKVSDPRVRTHFRPGRDARYVKRALAWMRYALNEAFDALVLVIDQDGKRDREEQFSSAQSDRNLPVRRALGVAIRTFDAWMLADEQALTAALGKTVHRQRQPERLADPKAVCIGLRDDAGSSMGLTEMYRRVAVNADLHILQERCSKGFRPFAQHVREL